MKSLKKIAPSILSADFANLASELKLIETAGADWIHVDVMDGHFVPNLTIGVPVVKSLNKVAKLPLDVHLMITDPEQYAEAFIKAGADYLTFHIEATDKPQELVSKIKALGCKAGVSLRPGTSLSALEPVLSQIDLVLVMTVEPGFGGQSFMEDQVAKIEELAVLRDKNNWKYLIEVDGGVNDKTVSKCEAADVLVAGSYVFKNPPYENPIAKLKGKS